MKDTKVPIPEDCTKENSSKCYFPSRYVFTVLGFLGFFNVYAMRVNLSVAMVAMVNSTSPQNNSFQSIACPMLINDDDDDDLAFEDGFKGDKYNWDAQKQGLILGSFFYGYIFSQVPGGTFAEKFGAKWLCGIGIFITAIFSLLTPFAASMGVTAFIVVRVLEGLGEGVTSPAMNVIISHWSPKFERSRISTIVFTGSQIGNLFAMPLSGWLSSTDLLGGWPSVFYVFGTVGVLWFMCWSVLVYETPAVHPRISKEELVYIQQNQDKKPDFKKNHVPWKAIFTSLPMWSLIIAHIGHHWGFLILLTELPSYMNTILHFNIKENGTLSALPYILQAVSAWIASYIADRIRKSGRLSVTTIRKIFNSIGFFGPAICLLGVTISGCRSILIVGLISLAMALNGFIYSGFNVTHVDMSPDFAGTLFGITNGISNICGIVGPATVGYFTSSGATIQNWNDVFYITAAMYTGTAVFFNLFASAKLQSWGLAQNEDNDLKTDIKKCKS